ncbi:cytochrome-c peroxidase [Methylorubrum thiocyanatum]|uniref:Methylamine utilization protein MauG n=1 Tax=Methylorubrum thiocyanatum TaxID=47958 RepID=A0AA40S1B4_9HYPH|nr:cytochrome c peroxidase [Methylorubrum thiocyanatum]MBA8912589.1 cytochrome c peroxidase [Methylorubrum thiocyanatum]GJE80255.1 Cytochrome c551 peroxidase [Methylorubrum thiocyanatum]
MAWKFMGGKAALLTILLGGLAFATHGEPDRSLALAEYRRPAAIPFPDDNPYRAAKAELGRTLFFEPALSRDGDRTCATCHIPGQDWTDSQPRAPRSDGGFMDFRTPTLLNVAWTEEIYGWDGKFRRLETVARTPLTAPGNMNMPPEEMVRRLAADPNYVKAFAGAFPETAVGDGGVTAERIEQALATFQRLIVSGPAPFDRWVEGDSTAVGPAAKRGFDVFTGKANCAACHSGWNFTDGSFHDIGVATEGAIGRGRFFPGSTALRHAFKTPTLRNVARRPPYMHDGSITNLSAVIDLYDRGGIDRPSRSRDIRPLHLTAREKADLIAFLETLNDAGADGPAYRVIGPVAPRP